MSDPNPNKAAADMLLPAMAIAMGSRFQNYISQHHGICGLCSRPMMQGEGTRQYKGYGKCHAGCAKEHEGPQPKLSRKQLRKARKER